MEKNPVVRELNKQQAYISTVSAEDLFNVSCQGQTMERFLHQGTDFDQQVTSSGVTVTHLESLPRHVVGFDR